MLIQCDICPTLVSLLISYQSNLDEIKSQVVFYLVPETCLLVVGIVNGKPFLMPPQMT